MGILRICGRMDGLSLESQVYQRREKKDWEKKVDMHDYLNKLGDEGWELVNAVPVPVQRILDTRADSFMETFRLVD